VSTRNLALTAIAVGAALLACGPWLAGPDPTPTSIGQAGGPRYLSAPAPAGYLVYDPAYDTASLFSSDGHMLEVFAELQWQGLGRAAGAAVTPLLAQEASTQLAYLGGDEQGATLNVRQGNSVRPLLALRDPTGLCGSIPAGYLSVADVVIQEDTGGLVGMLYLVDAGTGAGSDTPLLSLPVLRSSPKPLPVAIAFLDSSPSMLYYTLATPDEASGSFASGHGLFVLDLATRRVTTFLDDANRILGVSPDLTFVAFHAAQRTPPELRLARLDGASTVLFQPASGAREVQGAAFSPDSERLVWATVMAGSGAGPSFQLSMASTFGGPVTLADLGPLLPPDPDPIVRAYPVAWLTDSAILIQVDRGNSSTVYRYQVDTGGLTVEAAGTFITLFYP